MSETEQRYDVNSAYNTKPRAKDRYVDISGLNHEGKAKAHVVVSYSESCADGSNRVLREVTISRKPVVTVFRHAGYVNVCLDFLSSHDRDLSMVWDILNEYSRPINSIDWLPEELETGTYRDRNGVERSVFFPMLTLVLSPIGKETEYQLLGFNPLFYTLQPNNPTTGEACVIQLTFNESWFHVTEDLAGSMDMSALREEVMEELAIEMLSPGTGSI